jgi:hypothetical protein
MNRFQFKPPPNPNFLSAADAKQIKGPKDDGQTRCLNALIRLGERKIRTAATLGNDDTLWRVPAFDPDLCPYDLASMIKDLMIHFKQQGFYTKALGDILYLSWRYAD